MNLWKYFLSILSIPSFGSATTNIGSTQNQVSITIESGSIEVAPSVDGTIHYTLNPDSSNTCKGKVFEAFQNGSCTISIKKSLIENLQRKKCNYNLKLYVPSNVNLTIDNNSGVVSLMGVSGSFVVKSNSIKVQIEETTGRVLIDSSVAEIQINQKYIDVDYKVEADVVKFAPPNIRKQNKNQNALLSLLVDVSVLKLHFKD